jgi:hypothetical protein
MRAHTPLASAINADSLRENMLLALRVLLWLFPLRGAEIT